ncbi:capsid assembly protein [Ferrovibrio sp.]|uniref:capsid assembly protein n=1 Tax=Ferrovibrio sp. TaxID=1917215 RepID=UPI003D27458F
MTESLLDTPEQHAEIPEKFRDPATGALQADKLLKSYLALEKRMSRMVALPGEDADDTARQSFHRALGVPEQPEGYAIELRHPGLQMDTAVNARLHQAGFTPAQAQLVYDLACDHVMPQLEQMAAEMQGGRERDRLVQHFGSEARFRETARALNAWGQANLPAEVFNALASTYDGVLALETMLRGKEPGLRPKGTSGTDEALSEEQLVQLMRDPRYWKQRDPEILTKVTEGFRRLYPG